MGAGEGPAWGHQHQGVRQVRIWYIKNWSLALDIKIIWKTVFGGLMNNEKIIAEEKLSVKVKAGRM